MKKVAIYSRVSTEEQRDRGLSIAAQQQALLNYCENQGYTDVKEYSDEGVSANAMKKRKGFQRLLDDCRKGKVELILFTKLDRWFRSVAKYHIIQKELEDLGVVWMAINEPAFETITALGKGNINFYLTTAQMEVDRASERVKDVFKYKTSQGHALTKMPLGYKIGDDKKPAIDENTVDIAKFILYEYENIHSVKVLIMQAYEKFGVKLTANLVSRTLRNRRYTGYYRGNPNYFPALITEEQRLKNLDLAKKNLRHQKAPSGEHRVYLFAGLIKCTVCGGNWNGKISKGRHYYRCYKHYSTGLCGCNRTIYGPKLERLLLEHLKANISKFQIQAELVPKDEEPLIDIEELKDELERLNYMYQKKRITVEHYESEFERIDELFTKAAYTQPASVEMNMVLAPDFDELYKTMIPEERQIFWRSIIDYITIGNGSDIEPHFLA